MIKKSYFILLLILTLLPTSAQAKTSNRETPAVKVVRDWAPSVVNISTEKIVYLRQQPFWSGYGNALDSLFNDYFASQAVVSPVKLKSLGSGVVVLAEGLIVTNAHVVNMATQVYVIFSNGKSIPAEVILVNQQDDLALLKIKPPFSLTGMKLADPRSLMIGESVVAIGNPLGFENSVSTGVISGKNRTFVMQEGNQGHQFKGLIQTDAPINVGNSGGALMNLDGELVGINIAVIQNAQSIGFAISSEKIQAGIDFYLSRKKLAAKKGTLLIPVRVGP